MAGQKFEFLNGSAMKNMHSIQICLNCFSITNYKNLNISILGCYVQCHFIIIKTHQHGIAQGKYITINSTFYKIGHFLQETTNNYRLQNIKRMLFYSFYSYIVNAHFLFNGRLSFEGNLVVVSIRSSNHLDLFIVIQMLQ